MRRTLGTLGYSTNALRHLIIEASHCRFDLERSVGSGVRGQGGLSPLARLASLARVYSGERLMARTASARFRSRRASSVSIAACKDAMQGRLDT